MAKLNFYVAGILLLCFFVLSCAQTLPENGDNATTVEVSASISSLQISPENSDETTAAVVSLPDLEPIPDLLLPREHETDEAVSMPLTTVAYRPMHIRTGSKRRCHHHHHHHHHHHRRNEEITYGNDMLVSAGENGDFENPVNSRRWGRIHDHRHHSEENDTGSDSDSDSDSEDDRAEIRHSSRVMKLKSLRKIDERKKKWSLMKKVRKFLEQYF